MNNQIETTSIIPLSQVDDFVRDQESLADYEIRNGAVAKNYPLSDKGRAVRLITLFGAVIAQDNENFIIGKFKENFSGASVLVEKNAQNERTYHFYAPQIGKITFMKASDFFTTKLKSFTFSEMAKFGAKAPVKMMTKIKGPENYALSSGLIDLYQRNDKNNQSKLWDSWIETEKYVISPTLYIVMPKETFYDFYNVELLSKISGEDLKEDLSNPIVKEYMKKGDPRYILSHDEFVNLPEMQKQRQRQ